MATYGDVKGLRRSKPNLAPDKRSWPRMHGKSLRPGSLRAWICRQGGNGGLFERKYKSRKHTLSRLSPSVAYRTRPAVAESLWRKRHHAASTRFVRNVPRILTPLPGVSKSLRSPHEENTITMNASRRPWYEFVCGIGPVQWLALDRQAGILNLDGGSATEC